jgi:hypothetical protein
MPIEFSTAAYRFGHSMIRPGYRLNDNDATLLTLFADSQDQDLRGKHAMDPARGIDWGRFIDVDQRPYGVAGADSADNRKRLQFAYRIDTSLVNPLAHLPPDVADGVTVLSQRNLLRGFSLGLPSGQAVARAMDVDVIADSEILIGKAVDVQDPGIVLRPITDFGAAFKHNCPLWTYILAEAMQHAAAVPIPATGGPPKVNTPRLGPVGGRIVAEVFLGLMFGDSASLLRTDPGWKPAQAGYALKDFVLYATGR